MRFQAALRWLTKPLNLWLTVLIYTVAMGLLIQLVILPHVFPTWHAGHGLITGVDGLKFHRAALEMAQAIEAHGWGAWNLRAGGQVVSGVAAVFYVLIYPEPWSVLPLNGILNASACVCLFMILRRLTSDPVRALVATAPFVLFPSSLLWNTQFHNDNYAVPGVILMLCGWVTLVQAEKSNSRQSLLGILGALALVATGSVLLWIVRSYIFDSMARVMVLAAATLLLVRAIRRVGIPQWALGAAVMLAASATMLLVATALAPLERGGTSAPLPEQGTASVTDQGQNRLDRKWTWSAWMPRFVDQQLSTMAYRRRESIRLRQAGDSGIDLDVRLQSAADVVAYGPRALQIAFLSPFPAMWFSPGTMASGTAMRVVSAFEMIVVYACLLGLPLFLWRHRGSEAVWFMLAICTVMLTAYAMSVANIGALYRFRYPFLMPLVALGASGWLERIPFKSPAPRMKAGE
ncbi:MAG TPA: hypothetical protein VFH29_03685 [Anaerolineales bacterium]|nr:hypothetical protein [Anaerolineales bacterium]